MELIWPKVGNNKTLGHYGADEIQGLRYPSILYRSNRNASLVDQTFDAVDMTLKYHTSLSGTIIGDEHVGGLSPQRG